MSTLHRAFSMFDVAFLASSQPAAGGVIWRDDFGGSSASIAGRTPDTANNGNTWQIDTGGYSTNGSGEVEATDNVSRAWIESGVANCRVVARPTHHNGLNRRIGILFRFVDSNNHWRLMTRADTTTRWELVRVVSSTTTTVASGGGAAIPVDIAVELDGTTIRTFYDGSLVDTRTDSNHSTATKHGLANTNTSAGSRVDFVYVENL